MRKIGTNGIALLKELEGTRSKVYPDVAGLPSIGTGHLLTKDERSSGKIYIGGIPVKYVAGITDEQIESLLMQDLEKFEIRVECNVLVPLTQNQFDALVCFAFNVGQIAFANSTLLRLLNRGQYDQVPGQMMRWVHAGGKEIAGLKRRRQAEIELWGRA